VHLILRYSQAEPRSYRSRIRVPRAFLSVYIRGDFPLDAADLQQMTRP